MSLSSIAFIPDGNRRFAQSQGLSLASAYALGTQKAWDVVDWLKAYPSIKSGTFYTLSLENLTRKKTEIGVLFRIFEREIDKAFVSPLFFDQQIRLRFVGETSLLPSQLQTKMNRLQDQTSSYDGKTINLAIGYSGQNEIVSAAKKIAEQYQRGLLSLAELTTDSFKRFLYSDMASPDLIVRTSGTRRLSGFLTYQSAYSELHFVDKYWPQFDKTDLATAVSDFENRSRRFGK